MVDQDGVVWQRDLGADTAQVAADIRQFDPDQTWTPIAPEATTYLGFAGSEITFVLPLPFCGDCAPSRTRRPKSLFHRALMFAAITAAAFLGLVLLSDLALDIPGLGDYLLPASFVLAALIMGLVLYISRPKAHQTSYYQPVRINKLKREFLSGKVVGMRFAFTNPDYARQFAIQNREPIERDLIEVDG